MIITQLAGPSQILLAPWLYLWTPCPSSMDLTSRTQSLSLREYDLTSPPCWAPASHSHSNFDPSARDQPPRLACFYPVSTPYLSSLGEGFSLIGLSPSLKQEGLSRFKVALLLFNLPPMVTAGHVRSTFQNI